MALAKLRGANQSALEAAHSHVQRVRSRNTGTARSRFVERHNERKTAYLETDGLFHARRSCADDGYCRFTANPGKAAYCSIQPGRSVKDMFGGIGNAAKHWVRITVKHCSEAGASVPLLAWRSRLMDMLSMKLPRNITVTQALVSTGKFTGKARSETQQISECQKSDRQIFTSTRGAERLTASGKITGQQLKTAMIGVVEGAAVTRRINRGHIRVHRHGR